MKRRKRRGKRKRRKKEKSLKEFKLYRRRGIFMVNLKKKFFIGEENFLCWKKKKVFLLV